MRRAAKVDGNHGEIVELLRFCGYEVQSLAAVGNGVPDLLVAVGTENVLFEVKMPGEKLNAVQARWHRDWPGDKYIVDSREIALRICVKIERLRALEDQTRRERKVLG